MQREREQIFNHSHYWPFTWPDSSDLPLILLQGQLSGWKIAHILQWVFSPFLMSFPRTSLWARIIVLISRTRIFPTHIVKNCWGCRTSPRAAGAWSSMTFIWGRATFCFFSDILTHHSSFLHTSAWFISSFSNSEGRRSIRGGTQMLVICVPICCLKHISVDQSLWFVMNTIYRRSVGQLCDFILPLCAFSPQGSSSWSTLNHRPASIYIHTICWKCDGWHCSDSFQRVNSLVHIWGDFSQEEGKYVVWPHTLWSTIFFFGKLWMAMTEIPGIGSEKGK